MGVGPREPPEQLTGLGIPRDEHSEQNVLAHGAGTTALEPRGNIPDIATSAMKGFVQTPVGIPEHKV